MAFRATFAKRFRFADELQRDSSEEGRLITAEFARFYAVTVYTPNAKDDLSRLALRHKHWDPAFLAYVQQLEKKKPVVFCGDMNVAHTELDLANPKPNRGKKGFTDEEREGFQNLVAAGFIDTLRLFREGNGHYTWWSHFANSRARNVGWRIDYVLVSAALRKAVKAAEIHADVMGSDHCPVSVTPRRVAAPGRRDQKIPGLPPPAMNVCMARSLRVGNTGSGRIVCVITISLVSRGPIGGHRGSPAPLGLPLFTKSTQ